MIDLSYPTILTLFQQHTAAKRNESAAFLIWYLENYYRLETVEATDCVCDQRYDKGIDGIYVNDNDSTISIFQAKLSQNAKATVGDTVLKEFAGSLQQFHNRASIENLLNSGANSELIRLIQSTYLIDKIEGYEMKGVFISNTELDPQGESLLKSMPKISFVGRKKLIQTYISDKRTQTQRAPATFDISGFSYSEYIVDQTTSAVIAPIKARELVTLDGIGDQSIFDLNVRGPLGKTQVNKDIVNSIRKPSTHRLFPLFHNGITFICNKVDVTPDKVKIKGYYVVNGCQSLSSLYENAQNLTDDLRILTKFVQLDVNSGLSEEITRYSNNQNGVKARDFKSNHPIQVRLQNEFNKHYSNQYHLEVKRGELTLPGQAISNEAAGLYLMSFDLKEPWGTHRKYQVFEDKYADLFAKPEVNADRIVLCHEIISQISSALPQIKNQLFGKYELTRFVLLYMIRRLLENDVLGQQAISNPHDFVRGPKDRSVFNVCISQLVEDIIVDVNAEIEEYGDDFDYRGKLRDDKWVKELTNKVVTNYLKLVKRGRITSFSDEWSKSKN